MSSTAQSVDSTASADSGPKREYRVWFPEYGPVEGVLGLGLFYVFVGRATAVIMASVAESPLGFSADLIGLLGALLLWFVVLTTLFAQAKAQLDANPHRFDDRDDRDAFLAAKTPDELSYLLNLGLAAVGGYVVVSYWEVALTAFEGWMRLFATAGFDAIGPGDWVAAVVVAVFVLGFALLSHGVDRLLVGAVREVVALGYE